MFHSNFINLTPTASIVINIAATVTDSRIIAKYEEKPYFDKLCEYGCPNYGCKWSCPPFSPNYSSFLAKYPHIILVLMWCNLDQFHYTKTEYMKVKASNSILKSRMDSLMKDYESAFDGFTLSNGSCRLCNPCNKKKQLPCKKPTKMRFSMESLGLNVEKISNDFFKHKLLWYKEKTAPAYSSVLSCLLTTDETSEKSIDNAYKSWLYEKDKIMKEPIEIIQESFL